MRGAILEQHSQNLHTLPTQTAVTITELFNDKTLKPKERTDALSKLILQQKIGIEELMTYAAAKDSPRATCIEALTLASEQKPGIVNEPAFEFVVQSLTAKAPRIKWEAARAIANAAHLHKEQLSEAIENLLVNAKHEGTVVRWSTATALGKIFSLRTKYNKTLLPLLTKLHAEEEKGSIRKIYKAAIDKAEADQGK
jgi:hypothetical protein